MLQGAGNKRPFAEPKRHRHAAVVLVVALLLLSSGGAPAQAEVPRLDLLKAAFLFNFAKFTNWPPEKPRDDRVQFCVERGALDPRAFEEWESETLQGLPIQARIIPRAEDGATETCHILLVHHARQSPPSPKLRAHARANHILLVSAAQGFAETGGHIGLFIEDNRLRFRVNLDAAEQAKLSLSSQLLRLAEIVRS